MANGEKKNLFRAAVKMMINAVWRTCPHIADGSDVNPSSVKLKPLITQQGIRKCLCFLCI